MIINKLFKKELVKEELEDEAPYGFRFITNLPEVIKDNGKFYYRIVSQVADGPFNTLEEAKEHFMNHFPIIIEVLSVMIDAEDQKMYLNKEDFDEFENEIYLWEERIQNLISSCNIHLISKKRRPEGVSAVLEAPVNNLLQFMSLYTDRFDDDGSEGEALFEESKYLLKVIDDLFDKNKFLRFFGEAKENKLEEETESPLGLQFAQNSKPKINQIYYFDYNNTKWGPYDNLMLAQEDFAKECVVEYVFEDLPLIREDQEGNKLDSSIDSIDLQAWEEEMSALLKELSLQVTDKQKTSSGNIMVTLEGTVDRLIKFIDKYKYVPEGDVKQNHLQKDKKEIYKIIASIFNPEKKTVFKEDVEGEVKKPDFDFDAQEHFNYQEVFEVWNNNNSNVDENNDPVSIIIKIPVEVDLDEIIFDTDYEPLKVDASPAVLDVDTWGIKYYKTWEDYKKDISIPEEQVYDILMCSKEDFREFENKLEHEAIREQIKYLNSYFKDNSDEAWEMIDKWQKEQDEWHGWRDDD